MYFIRSQFKNVITKMKPYFKDEILKIKNDDVIYVFDDGFWLHETSGKHVQLTMIADNKEEMQAVAKTVFNKYVLIFKPSTTLQKKNSPFISAFILKYKEVFVYLVQKKLRSCITQTIIMSLLKCNREDAKEFINTCVTLGIFIKLSTSWYIPQKQWVNLRTMLGQVKDFESQINVSENDDKQFESLLARKYPDLFIKLQNGATQEEIQKIIDKREV